MDKQMNTSIEEAIGNLQQAISDYGDGDCTSIKLFFNCEGMELTVNKRTADQLKAADISMRNVRGEFIK